MNYEEEKYNKFLNSNVTSNDTNNYYVSDENNSSNDKYNRFLNSNVTDSTGYSSPVVTQPVQQPIQPVQQPANAVQPQANVNNNKAVITKSKHEFADNIDNNGFNPLKVIPNTINGLSKGFYRGVKNISKAGLNAFDFIESKNKELGNKRRDLIFNNLYRGNIPRTPLNELLLTGGITDKSNTNITDIFKKGWHKLLNKHKTLKDLDEEYSTYNNRTEANVGFLSDLMFMGAHGLTGGVSKNVIKAPAIYKAFSKWLGNRILRRMATQTVTGAGREAMSGATYGTLKGISEGKEAKDIAKEARDEALNFGLMGGGIGLASTPAKAVGSKIAKSIGNSNIEWLKNSTAGTMKALGIKAKNQNLRKMQEMMTLIDKAREARSNLNPEDYKAIEEMEKLIQKDPLEAYKVYETLKHGYEYVYRKYGELPETIKSTTKSTEPTNPNEPTNPIEPVNNVEPVVEQPQVIDQPVVNAQSVEKAQSLKDFSLGILEKLSKIDEQQLAELGYTKQDILNAIQYKKSKIENSAKAMHEAESNKTNTNETYTPNEEVVLPTNKNIEEGKYNQNKDTTNKVNKEQVKTEEVKPDNNTQTESSTISATNAPKSDLNVKDDTNIIKDEKSSKNEVNTISEETSEFYNKIKDITLNDLDKLNKDVVKDSKNLTKRQFKRKYGCNKEQAINDINKCYEERSKAQRVEITENGTVITNEPTGWSKNTNDILPTEDDIAYHKAKNIMDNAHKTSSDENIIKEAYKEAKKKSFSDVYKMFKRGVLKDKRVINHKGIKEQEFFEKYGYTEKEIIDRVQKGKPLPERTVEETKSFYEDLRLKNAEKVKAEGSDTKYRSKYDSDYNTDFYKQNGYSESLDKEGANNIEHDINYENGKKGFSEVNVGSERTRFATSNSVATETEHKLYGEFVNTWKKMDGMTEKQQIRAIHNLLKGKDKKSRDFIKKLFEEQYEKDLDYNLSVAERNKMIEQRGLNQKTQELVDENVLNKKLVSYNKAFKEQDKKGFIDGEDLTTSSRKEYGEKFKAKKNEQKNEKAVNNFINSSIKTTGKNTVEKFLNFLKKQNHSESSKYKKNEGHKLFSGSGDKRELKVTKDVSVSRQSNYNKLVNKIMNSNMSNEQKKHALIQLNKAVDMFNKEAKDYAKVMLNKKQYGMKSKTDYDNFCSDVDGMIEKTTEDTMLTRNQAYDKLDEAVKKYNETLKTDDFETIYESSKGLNAILRNPANKEYFKNYNNLTEQENDIIQNAYEAVYKNHKKECEKLLDDQWVKEKGYIIRHYPLRNSEGKINYLTGEPESYKYTKTEWEALSNDEKLKIAYDTFKYKQQTREKIKFNNNNKRIDEKTKFVENSQKEIMQGENKWKREGTGEYWGEDNPNKIVIDEYGKEKAYKYEADKELENLYKEAKTSKGRYLSEFSAKYRDDMKKWATEGVENVNGEKIIKDYKKAYDSAVKNIENGKKSEIEPPKENTNLPKETSSTTEAPAWLKKYDGISTKELKRLLKEDDSTLIEHGFYPFEIKKAIDIRTGKTKLNDIEVNTGNKERIELTSKDGSNLDNAKKVIEGTHSCKELEGKTFTVGELTGDKNHPNANTEVSFTSKVNNACAVLDGNGYVKRIEINPNGVKPTSFKHELEGHTKFDNLVKTGNNIFKKVREKCKEVNKKFAEIKDEFFALSNKFKNGDLKPEENLRYDELLPIYHDYCVNAEEVISELATKGEINLNNADEVIDIITKLDDNKLVSRVLDNLENSYDKEEIINGLRKELGISKKSKKVQYDGKGILQNDGGLGGIRGQTQEIQGIHSGRNGRGLSSESTVLKPKKIDQITKDNVHTLSKDGLTKAIKVIDTKIQKAISTGNKTLKKELYNTRKIVKDELGKRSEEVRLNDFDGVGLSSIRRNEDKIQNLSKQLEKQKQKVKNTKDNTLDNNKAKKEYNKTVTEFKKLKSDEEYNNKQSFISNLLNRNKDGISDIIDKFSKLENGENNKKLINSVSKLSRKEVEKRLENGDYDGLYSNDAKHILTTIKDSSDVAESILKSRNIFTEEQLENRLYQQSKTGHGIYFKKGHTKNYKNNGNIDSSKVGFIGDIKSQKGVKMSDSSLYDTLARNTKIQYVDELIKQVKNNYGLTEENILSANLNKSDFIEVNEDLLFATALNGEDKFFYEKLNNGLGAEGIFDKSSDSNKNAIAFWNQVLYNTKNSNKFYLKKSTFEKVLGELNNYDLPRYNKIHKYDSNWGKYAVKTAKGVMAVNNNFLNMFKRSVLSNIPFIKTNIISNQFLIMGASNPAEYVKSFSDACKMKFEDLPSEIKSNILNEIYYNNGFNVSQKTGIGLIDWLSDVALGTGKFDFSKSATIWTKITSGFKSFAVLRNKIQNLIFKANNKVEEFSRKQAYSIALNRAMKQKMKTTCNKAIIAQEMSKFVDENPEYAPLINKYVEDVLGDYRTFGRIERNIFKQIFPFYSWKRHISRYSVNMAIKDPTGFASLHKIFYDIKHADDDEREDYQKGYVDTGYVDKNGTGKKILSSSRRGIPFGSMEAKFGDGDINPIAKLIAEATVGKKRQFGKFNTHITNSRYLKPTDYKHRKEYYDSKKDEYVKNIPLTTRLGYIGTNLLRYYSMGNNPLVDSYEKWIYALYKKAKGGKGKIVDLRPDKLYDSGLGGFKDGDEKGWRAKSRQSRELEKFNNWTGAGFQIDRFDDYTIERRRKEKEEQIEKEKGTLKGKIKEYINKYKQK